MTARTEGVGPDADPEQGTWQPPTAESENEDADDDRDGVNGS